MSEPVFSYTGNPFVDMGIDVLLCLSGIRKPEEITFDDLAKQTGFLSDLYVLPEWKKNLMSIFPGSILTNLQFKGDVKAEYQVFLEELTLQACFADERQPGTGCMACARKSPFLMAKYRDRGESGYTKSWAPLSGSGKMVNYFSSGSMGDPYCPACMLAIQFMPLALHRIAGKFGLISITDRKLVRNQFREGNLRLIMAAPNAGIPAPFGKNSKNVFVSLAQHTILLMNRGGMANFDNRDDMEPETLTPPVSAKFYCFTNFNQGPEMELWNLPSQTFQFLRTCTKAEYRKGWADIRSRPILARLAKAQEKKGFSPTKVLGWENPVIDGLLLGKPLTRWFLDMHEGRVYGGWKILEAYAEEVIGLRKEEIATIGALGDRLADYCRGTHVKKELFALRNATTLEGWRTALRNIGARYSVDLQKPLFSLEEFAFLIGETTRDEFLSWKTIRDMVFIRLCEKFPGWTEGDFQGTQTLASEEVSFSVPGLVE